MKIMDAQKSVSSQDMRNLIERKYQWPEWALFWEVASFTGHRRGKSRRFADGMALHMWPTRGLELHGFEIKVSRSDWLSELKKPEKSQPLLERCHRWWVVAPSVKIVKQNELPEGWGLMTIGKFGLRVVRRASHLSPRALDYNFMTCVVRRAFEQSEARVKSQMREATAVLTREVNSLRQEVRRLRKAPTLRRHRVGEMLEQNPKPMKEI